MKLRSVAILFFAGIALAQTPVTRPEFEVASVKPTRNITPGGTVQLNPGRFIAKSLTLRWLILTAYKLQDFQVSGGAGWTTSDRYDIEAETGGVNREDMVLRMLQALLEDRFKLSMRRLTKEGPVYLLSIGKSGVKMPQSNCVPAVTDQEKEDGCGVIHRRTEGPNQALYGRGITLTSPDGVAYESLAWQLGISLQRTVIDRTGLTGRYDADLRWARDQAPEGNAGGAPPADLGGPSIFSAVQDQLGLKLESRTAHQRANQETGVQMNPRHRFRLPERRLLDEVLRSLRARPAQDSAAPADNPTDFWSSSRAASLSFAEPASAARMAFLRASDFDTFQRLARFASR
jgi:uncharacterized protein (TIGR03435 family)